MATRKTQARAALPASPAPMLCTLVDRAFNSEDWIFEPKFDGLRILARFDGRDVTLLSRNNKPQQARFPEIAEAIRASLNRPAIVDGEVVCFDDRGRTSFRELQQRFHLDDPAEIARRMERHPAFIYLFDILHNGQDLTGLPLAERKALLDEAVDWSDRVRRTEFEVGNGVELWKKACRAGQEGIIGKRIDSRYVAGRSAAWVKIKCVGRQEFAIGGWTDPQRSRVGLGALLVGYYDRSGERFRYAGKVGTGYTREVLLDLRRRLDEIGVGASPFDEGDPPSGVGVQWVKPRLVAEVAFAEWTQNGLLRQPRFEGLRPDKKPRDCHRERPKSAAAVRSNSALGDSSMPLKEYRTKRDFKKTREPSGTSKAKAHKEPIFVVQEHHASHLHYDFRLEADGVLKSWAVPKGPSMDPAVKRLAVQVEDHPLGYATFEGTIPKRQYGGGTVKVWDHGTYENLMEGKAEPQTVPEAIEAGHVEFALHGDRLQGPFALVRMKGRGRGKPQWLLIKMKDEFARAAATAKASRPKPRPARSIPSRPSRSSKPPKGEVALTHPDKVLFPGAGLTKRDVFTYYQRIADRLIPFLKDRPATLERLPDGLTGNGAPHFWQKNTPESYPDWIARADLETERGEPIHYALVNDEATLLYLVNQGTLTFHVWASRTADLDRPDFVLFDLDPGRASFGQVIDVARTLKGILDEDGVESFLKTSGKTGLHVMTPWHEAGDHDDARAWALAVAERVVAAMPGRATVERLKAKRGRRVYVDVMQNARGHHAVPPYVIRAVPAATISTPLNWKELTADLDPAAFTPRSIFRRLARQSHDPLAGLLKARRPRRAGSR
jgi:bifunctional non-homologous end joining protein LigD